jgi:membrane protein YdbS with pleckstrin-like domain
MTLMPEGDRPAGAAIVAKYLLPAEAVHIVKRRHWAVLAVPVSVTVLGLLVAFTLDTGLPAVPLLRDIIWIAWAVLLTYLIWQLVEWWFDRFIVTDTRIMLVTGIITRKVAMMPLVKVTDMSYERSVLARMLGYGEFIMESAGQDQALRKVEFVPQPDWLYREICALLFAPEQQVTAPPRPPASGPTLLPGSEPPGPAGPSDLDDRPPFGPGYGPDGADEEFDKTGPGTGRGSGSNTGPDAGPDAGRAPEQPAPKPPGSTVPY